MDYISEMRRLIGNRPLLMVGATVCIQDPQGRLLMMLRTDNGCWGLPGGAVEPGESVEEAARRETLEETGLQVGDLELYGVFSGPELFYRYPNGDQVHIVQVIYRTSQPGGEIVLDPAEHSQYAYFPLSALPENISPPLLPALRQLVDRRS